MGEVEEREAVSARRSAAPERSAPGRAELLNIDTGVLFLHLTLILSLPFTSIEDETETS